jgi:hypothetical protein
VFDPTKDERSTERYLWAVLQGFYDLLIRNNEIEVIL